MTKSPKLSLHILLPEIVDHRFERWARRMPGASWPAWGGHITLVPSFVCTCTPEEIFDLVVAATKEFSPFRVRLSEPEAVQDWTRPQYQAVLLKATDADRAEGTEGDGHDNLVRLQEAVKEAVAPVRSEVIKPELEAQPFVPHVTLALGLGEMEASRLVNAIRTDPIDAEFVVDEVSLVVMPTGEGGESKVQRMPIRLGKSPPPAGILSD